MANHYSKKELRRMLKTRSCFVDAPSWLQQKIDKIRQEQIRNAPTNEEIIDEMMGDEARRWQPVKRPTWITRFKKILGSSSRFANKLRGLIIK